MKSFGWNNMSKCKNVKYKNAVVRLYFKKKEKFFATHIRIFSKKEKVHWEFIVNIVIHNTVGARREGCDTPSQCLVFASVKPLLSFRRMSFCALFHRQVQNIFASWPLVEIIALYSSANFGPDTSDLRQHHRVRLSSQLVLWCWFGLSGPY